MGNKDSKHLDIDQFLQAAGDLSAGGRLKGSKKKSSTEALADCLASLSDMANTGVDPSASQDIPGRTNSTEQNLTPRTVRRVSLKLKQKLQSQTSSVTKCAPTSSANDVDAMLHNLSIQDGSEDNDEWANMRSWLVWCMRSNLREIDDEADGLPVMPHSASRGRRLSRQSAVFVDHAPCTSRRLSYQTAFDVDRQGKMSTQSSLESNAET